MNDTPRVTVPVEHWTDVITPAILTDDQLNDAWKAPGGEGEFWGMWDDKPHRLIYRLLGHIKALSSAPAPEGGAVDDLVDRFAAALKDKLRAAEAKYGHDDAWMRDDWRDDLVYALCEHIDKGDPRDVAAYCAFAWHHGWSLALATREEAPAEAGVKAADLKEAFDLWTATTRAEDQTAWSAFYAGSKLPRRAQPPAREEAHPVAWRAASEIHGWLLPHLKHMISFNTFHDVVVKALRSDPTTSPSHAPEAEKLLKALRDQSWDLRCFNIPTGGDDYDIGWRVIGHWQAEPCERTVAEVFSDDPAEAVRQALAALQAEQKGGA